MKLIWRISAPYYNSGIGTTTIGVVQRIEKDGHQVLVIHNQGDTPFMRLNDIATCGVHSPVGVDFINKAYCFDYIFTDPGYRDAGETYSNAVVLISFDFINMPKKLADDCRYGKFFFTLSQHNKREAEKLGFKSTFVPWGIDTEVYRPDPMKRLKFRQRYGISGNTFVIGSIGNAYYKDRKNLKGLIKAFNIFSRDHNDSILYLHTLALSELIYDDVKANNKILCCDQAQLLIGNISVSEMVETHNGFDVFCLPTKGEAYCQPLIEAQSCGCPPIITDTSACTENTFGGWLIPSGSEPGPYDTNWASVKVEDVVYALEDAYKKWKSGELKEMGLKVREKALLMDWNIVYPKYWKPFLADLEDKKNG